MYKSFRTSLVLFTLISAPLAGLAADEATHQASDKTTKTPIAIHAPAKKFAVIAEFFTLPNRLVDVERPTDIGYKLSLRYFFINPLFFMDVNVKRYAHDQFGWGGKFHLQTTPLSIFVPYIEWLFDGVPQPDHDRKLKVGYRLATKFDFGKALVPFVEFENPWVPNRYTVNLGASYKFNSDWSMKFYYIKKVSTDGDGLNIQVIYSF